MPEEKDDRPKHEKSPEDRAPRQKNTDRDPIKPAEETKDIPTQHGTLK